MYRSIFNCLTVIFVLNLVRGNGAYQWVPLNLKTDNIPPGAVEAGKDVGGDKLYVARIYREKDILPAKAIPTKKICFTSNGGLEFSSESCEVLVQDKLSWMSESYGKLPKGALEVGKNDLGEKLYYGRVTYNGYMTPGKIHPQLGRLYYGFGGKEYESKHYEALVAE